MIFNGAVYSTKAEDSRIYKPLSNGRFICGIADGHGGCAAARLCKEHISTLDDVCNPTSLFREIHDKCLALECNSGASLTVCFVNDLEVQCANVGDSHALVVTPTSHYWISESHRLQDNVNDRTLLSAQVGYAQCDGKSSGPPRLYPGGLMCSRSVGDADCPFISCKPSVCHTTLDADDIVIVASDGLWDAMPLHKVCKVARETRCAETLLRTHKQHFSDDTSVIMVSTKTAKKPYGVLFRVSSNGSISSDDDDPPIRRVFKVTL